jgi:hypothetical protein
MGGFTLRDLQSHVLDEDEPLAFREYVAHVGRIYQQMKANMSRLKNVYKDSVGETHN